MSLDHYVGIPWRVRGRDFDGCDCWGLLRLIYLHERGIELPSFSDQYVTLADKASIEALIEGNRSDWGEVQRGSEIPFDAIQMRGKQNESHIAMVIGNGQAIHMPEGLDSRIFRYRSMEARSQVVRFYRHGAR